MNGNCFVRWVIFCVYVLCTNAFDVNRNHGWFCLVRLGHVLLLLHMIFFSFPGSWISYKTFLITCFIAFPRAHMQDCHRHRHYRRHHTVAAAVVATFLGRKHKFTHAHTNASWLSQSNYTNTHWLESVNNIVRCVCVCVFGTYLYRMESLHKLYILYTHTHNRGNTTSWHF